MNIPKPFTDVFRSKPIFVGSEWGCILKMYDKDDTTEEMTPISLNGYTIKMIIDGDTKTIKTFTPTDNEIDLKLSATEQKSIFSGVTEPDKRKIEIDLYNDSENYILVIDKISIFPTMGGSL